MNKSYLFVGVLFLLISISCASRKEIVYLQNSNIIPENNYEKYAPRIQNEDLITITVSAADFRTAS